MSISIEELAPQPGRKPRQGADIAMAIAEHLRRAIFNGRLQPGARLTEQRLAEHFAVNRARIRSVLQTLAHERLLTVVHNRGAVVATPAIEESRQLFAARRAIESVTTESAARVVLTHQLGALRRSIELQRTTGSAGRFNEALKAMGEFHRSVAEIANNRVLVEVLQPLLIRTSLVVAVYGHHQTLSALPDLQAAVVDRLEAGTATAAARAMERAIFNLEHQLDFRPRHAEMQDFAAALHMIE
jgi:DNA-binding GntR family transcriptional regulator